LWEEGFLERDQTAKFHTLSGSLFASWNDGWIQLDFPSLPIETMDAPDALTRAIPTPFRFTGKSPHAWFVELESENAVRNVRPDFGLLKELDRDVIISSHSSTTDYDLVSRYFAPRHAIDEDPVTGSAHCVLAPYWAEKLGKKELRAFQASQRGGFLRLRHAGDRTLMSGQAVTVLRGELVNM
jgi:PhzF family phenazine biosynthesis protein